MKDILTPEISLLWRQYDEFQSKLVKLSESDPLIDTILKSQLSLLLQIQHRAKQQVISNKTVDLNYYRKICGDRK